MFLHDKPKDGPEWTQQFEADDLFERLLDLVDIRYTLDAALHRALTRDFFNLLSGPFLRAIRTSIEDPSLKELGDAFVAGLLHARDRMFELGWQLAS